MKKTIIIYFVLIINSQLDAQNIISGKITNQDKKPLVGTTIFIPEMNKGTVSKEDGSFEISNLPNGKIKIQFSYMGYANQIKTLNLVSESIRLDIELHQSAIEAEEIVVSGGYSSSQHENAVKIEVLKLMDLSIKSTPNFAEILTSVPGVDMISKGSGVSKPVIRGLSMNDILVLNNGVRFENYQYSSHHPLGIDEFGVEDVEIIKGPASLLYGSDAIGGVVNFIKEKPAPIGSIVGDYNLQMFSNSLGMTNNIGIKGASKNIFGGVRIGQKTNADYTQGGGDFVPNSRFNEKSLKANFGITDRIGTFKLFYDYNNQKLGLVEDEAVETITKRDRTNKIWYQELNTHLISSQNKLYFGKFKLDINSAYQNTELIHFGEVDEIELQMKLATLTYDAKIHLPTNEKSEFIIGFQGFNQSNKNINLRETILLPDAITNNYSVFALLQHDFFKKLKLQTGLRYDIKTIKTQAVGIESDSTLYRAAINKMSGSFSGSFGATYHFCDKLLFRSNFAAAYRTPNIAELTSKGPHELRFELGDNSLIPENAYETDFSIHYHAENFTLDIAGFYNIISNYIFISPTNDTTSSGMEIFKYKQANVILYGGEAGLHFHPKNLKFLHFLTTFSSVVGKQENGDFLPFIPAHKWNVELKIEKENFLFFKNSFVALNTNTAFNQNNAAPDETTTNGYTILDFSIGGKIKAKNQSVSMVIGINNLLDTKYIDHLSTLKEVNLFNPGRNIFLSLKIPFGVK